MISYTTTPSSGNLHRLGYADVLFMALIMQRYLCGARPMLLCLLEHSNVEIGISKTLLGYFKCTYHERCMPVGVLKCTHGRRCARWYSKVPAPIDVRECARYLLRQSGTAMMDYPTKRHAHYETSRHGQYKETQHCKWCSRLKQKERHCSAHVCVADCGVPMMDI